MSNLKKQLSLGLLLISGTVAASAADGCKFLLCMGAPNPMGISECAPTVKEVLRDLKKGRGLPGCKLSSGEDSKTQGNYVAYYKTKVPTCPVGYNEYGKIFYKYHKGKPNKKLLTTGGVTPTKNSRVCLKGNMNGYIKPKNDIYTHEWYDDIAVTYKDGKKYEFVTFINGQVQSKHRF